MAENGHPKVFISYSWTSDAYKERVLNLAERLVNDGVDVIFDRWDLRPGQDMYAFMEQSIKEAEKVLILCEKGYAEKANNRTGGVGTETEIITSDVYREHRQEKFIPVVMEIPKAVPLYLKSRYALYFTKGEEYEYRTLCRTLFGLSERRKPLLGKIPIWLDGESHVNIEVSSYSEVLNSKQSTDAGSSTVKPDLGNIPEWLKDKGCENDGRTESVLGSRTIAETSVKRMSTKGEYSLDSGRTEHISLHKGDRKYELGHYPQGENGEIKPLLWRVLDIDTTKNMALLITEVLIDCRRYHENWEEVTWENCDFRKWLNNEFIHKAFDKKDLKKIVKVSLRNSNNKKYGTEGGRTTDDMIFALSIEEVEKYFQHGADRKTMVTPYTKRQGNYSNIGVRSLDSQTTGWWWLRSPGGDSNCASIVNAVGDILVFGNNVNRDDICVRPALWLKI